MFRVLLATLLAAVLSTPEANCQQRRPRTSPPSFFVGGSLGYGVFSMDDVNNELSQLRSLGINIDLVERGPSLDLFVGMETQNGGSFCLGYERLFASTSYSDYSGSIKYDLPANIYYVTANIPLRIEPGMRQQIEFTAGRMVAAGKLSLSVSEYGSSTNISGNIDGTGFMLRGALSMILGSPREPMGFQLTCGYRLARISGIEILGQPIEGPGGDYALDYSGLYAQAGIILRAPH